MSPPRRRVAILGLVLVTALILAMPALAAAATRGGPYRACTLSVGDQRPPGGTPAYALTVEQRRTSCATAKKVMRAFHRCRTASWYRCPRRVLGRWRCSGRRKVELQLLAGLFTCRRGARRVRGTYLQDRPSCFGAAARDPKLPCFSKARDVSPKLGEEDPESSWHCNEREVPGACVFGVSDAKAKRHVALIGDSHASHWRAPLNLAAHVKGWRGYSMSTGGCFFSSVTRRFIEGCDVFYRQSLTWLSEHPEVDTVFVTQNADTPVTPLPGKTVGQTRLEGFKQAFEALPKSVEHVIVLRDTTASTPRTLLCATRAIESGDRRLAPLCPLARSVAVRPDHAVAAVRELDSERYQWIDLTRYMCSRRYCYPIVGGTLVNADVYGHLRMTFARTLAPYLLREIGRLQASW